MARSFLGWPVLRQLRGHDPLGRGPAVRSKRTDAITPRTATADRVARSVCPYCAVGCGQKVFVKDEKVVQIEGDPDTAMNMIADRVVKARNDTWQEIDEEGRRVRRTLGIASLGGATLDNEENYLIKKLFTAMGAIQIENQARI